jgi:predicted ATPase/DNA-binding SARP family transcriptional activator
VNPATREDPERAPQPLGQLGPAFRIALLGSPVLQAGDASTALALPPRGHTLLALLALGYERPVLRSRLAASLWPDVPENDARTNLRRHLHLIARALPPDADALLLTKSTAQWNPAARISCDLVEFLIASGHARRYNEAARLYVGELCVGILDDDLEPLRTEVAARHDTVLRSLAAAARASSDHASAVLALHRLLERDPLDESTARELVLARFEGGDRAGALREYHALVARLYAELEVEPEPQTTALLERMLTLERDSATPHNLVAPASSFVGRAAELRTIVEAFERDRMVTLVGPPGIGKTRLAIESAFVVLNRFGDGVRFVELARDDTAAAAVERIAHALDAAAASDPLEGVVAGLGRKAILLVLDNLEQLGDDARVVIDALTSRTAVRILGTSRRRVRAVGERVIAIGALDVPPAAPTLPDALARYGAVRLFLERATKVAPHVRLTYENARSVAAILRRLDGIPLAIELVASRANLLTIEGISKRLDERFAFANPRREERHVTIDGAIAWSYELLTPVEQAVFRRIAVFADSCTPEALEEVCASVTADSVGPVSELVESSLLTTEATGEAIRYRTFELTRSFAIERLHEHGEYDEAARRHADHYAQLAESLYDDFTSDGEQAAYLRCDLEDGNFALALGWSLEHDAVCAARLVAAVWRYWIFRGRARAGEAAVERLERDGSLERLTVAQRGRVLQAAGMLARETQLRDASRYLEQALAHFRECGDGRGESEMLTAIAAVAFSRNDYEDAERRFSACLALQEARGERRAALGTLANLAQLAWVRGDCESALATLDRVLDGFRETKNARGVAYVFRTRSAIFGTLGRIDEAIDQAQQSVALYESLGEPARVAEALSGLSDQYAWSGRLGEAFAAVRRSFELLAEVRNDVFLCNALRSLHFVASRAQEHKDVLRIDTVLRTVARRIGQKPDNTDGTTQRAVALARAALPAFLADAAVEAAAAMDDAQILPIARRLAERHVGSVIEPFGWEGSDDDRTLGLLS